MLSTNLSLWPWKLRLAFLPATIPPYKCRGSFQFSALHKEFFMFSIFNLLLFTVTVMTLGSETSQELMTNLTKITPSAAADNRSAPDLTWPAGTNLSLKLGDVLWVTCWEMSFVPVLMAYMPRVGLGGKLQEQQNVTQGSHSWSLALRHGRSQRAASHFVLLTENIERTLCYTHFSSRSHRRPVQHARRADRNPEREMRFAIKCRR